MAVALASSLMHRYESSINLDIAFLASEQISVLMQVQNVTVNMIYHFTSTLRL